jgi:hypothetical protein
VGDSPFSGDALLDEFRRRLGDTNCNFVQCEVSCDDASATGALLEVSDNLLSTTITGGSAADLVLDLTDPAYDTLEKLVDHLAHQAGYTARVASSGESTHHSTDLEVIPPKDCLRRMVQLKSRRWSDHELTNMLNTALVKLSRDTGNIYDLTTVPSSVKDMMFLLGTIDAYWDQINNVTKRQGADLRVEDFRTLHQALLDEYGRSLASFLAGQPPIISTLTPEQLDDLGSGEIIVGTQMRRSLRTGRMVPSSASPFPASEQMAATFIGGAKVQLNWSRTHSSNFHHYEVWRGTTLAVSNISELARPSGSIAATGTKIYTEYAIERTLWVDGGTSPLPPGTYFYRLYVYDNNGQWAASDVVSATVT